MAEQVFYTIAQETSESYGMGGSGDVARICRRGAYEQGQWPPLFTSEEKAARWLSANRETGIKYEMVELVVSDG